MNWQSLLQILWIKHPLELACLVRVSQWSIRRPARAGQCADRSFPQAAVTNNSLRDTALPAFKEADDLHFFATLALTGSISYARLINLAQVETELARGSLSVSFSISSPEQSMVTAADSGSSACRSLAWMPRCRCAGLGTNAVSPIGMMTNDCDFMADC